MALFFFCYKDFPIDSQINGKIDPLVASRLNHKVADKYEDNAEKQNNSTKTKNETFDCSQDLDDKRICKDGTRGMRFDENCNHIDSCGMKEVDGMMTSNFSSYIIKNNEVYYEDPYFWKDGYITKIDGANPSSFNVLQLCKFVEMSGNQYAADKNYIYAGVKRLDYIDRSSFEYLGLLGVGAGMPVGSSVSMDKDNVYFGCGDIVEEADRKSFTIIGNSYSKDKDTVFYITFIIDADPKTIEALYYDRADGFSGNFALDKNNVYFEGNVISDVDPQLCKANGLKACLPENWKNRIETAVTGYIFKDGTF